MQAGGLYDIKFHTRDETLKNEKQRDTADKSTSKQQVCVSDSAGRYFDKLVISRYQMAR